MKSKGTVLIAGTNEKSIGRMIAKRLHDEGYEIWLYGRSAKKIEGNN